MRNMRTIKFFFLFFCISVLSLLADDIPTRDVEVTELFDLGNYKPKIKILGFQGNFFSVDNRENIYFTDFSNHRILKFAVNGEFIYQIGSIGQGKKDLYYTQGFFLRGDKVFVLNHTGREIKVFNRNGKYISGFKIPKASFSHTLYVYGNKIITDTKYKELKNYNKQKLISVFNEKGKKIKSFGRILKCQTFLGYKQFNSIYIDIIDNNIVGAFANYPIIFRYDFDGNEIFYKDLRKLKIREIQALKERSLKLGMDTPESIKTDNALRFVNYCSGFGANRDHQIYYSVKNKYCVLHFDENGNLLEKLILKLRNNPLTVEKMYVNEKGIFYGLGILSKGKRKIFFKF